MPLVQNTTSGALSRSRIASYITARESVSPVEVEGDAAQTLTAANLTVDKIITSTPTGSRAFTTPTGTQLAAAVTDEVTGTSFEFTIVNKAASTHAITLTAGTGVSIVGNAVVAHATSGTFIGMFYGTNQVEIYRK